MSFFSRLFKTEPDPREGLRPLWHKVVETAREPEWYVECGVADTVEGRFDMITLVLVQVMLRMEGEEDLRARTALLTELFVEDMDGQLRQQGIGDHVVGKHVGKLMSTLGGRTAAYRKGLAQGGDVLADAVRRNVSLADESRADAVAARMIALEARLAQTDADSLIDGEMAA